MFRVPPIRQHFGKTLNLSTWNVQKFEKTVIILNSINHPICRIFTDNWRILFGNFSKLKVLLLFTMWYTGTAGTVVRCTNTAVRTPKPTGTYPVRMHSRYSTKKKLFIYFRGPTLFSALPSGEAGCIPIPIPGFIWFILQQATSN